MDYNDNYKVLSYITDKCHKFNTIFSGINLQINSSTLILCFYGFASCSCGISILTKGI